MIKYKTEVLLIGGKYYDFSQVTCTSFPLLKYGLIKGGLVIDDCDAFFIEMTAAVFVLKHGDKWGLFPRIGDCLGGDIEWASEDNNPFIYDNYLIVSNRIHGWDPVNSYKTFILLKEGNKWKSVQILCSENYEIGLLEEDILDVKSEEDLISKLEDKYKVKLVTQDKHQIYDDSTEYVELNPESDFLSRFDLGGSRKNVLRMIMGSHPYLYDFDRALLYSVSHKNPFATILAGKAIIERALSSKKDDNYDKEYVHLALRRGVGYLGLGAQYAKESGDITLADIANELYRDARSDYYSRYPEEKKSKQKEEIKPDC